jgi:predicted proteasome-type protease
MPKAATVKLLQLFLISAFRQAVSATMPLDMLLYEDTA